MNQHPEFGRLVEIVDGRARLSRNFHREDTGQQPSWVRGRARMTLWYLVNSEPPQFAVSFGSSENLQATDTPSTEPPEEFTIRLRGDKWTDGDDVYTTKELVDLLMAKFEEASENY